MFSSLIQKKTILLCCIFSCLITFTSDQNIFASSDNELLADETSFNGEEKKTGLFSRILGLVLGKKRETKEISKSEDHSKLNEKLHNIENRISRISQQKYNVEHRYKNKYAATVKSKQLKRVLNRLRSQRNMITIQILTFPNTQNFLAKNNTTPVQKNSESSKAILKEPEPTLPGRNPIKTVSHIVTKGIREKGPEKPNVSEKNIQTTKNEIVKSILKEAIQIPFIETVEDNKTVIGSLLPTKVAENSRKQEPSQKLTNASEEIVLTKTNNNEIDIAKKSPVTKEINKETVKIETITTKTLVQEEESIKSVGPLNEKDFIEKNLVIGTNEVATTSNTNVPNRMEDQIRKMVVDGTTDEIKMALEDGDSIGVIRVLVEKNIKRQDLTLAERDTINDYIAILGKIGSKKDIKFLSDMKTINRELDDYYTHNIYTSIWKLKKGIERDRIETREDFDDVIDYISYIYNHYKNNTNENMRLYDIEVDFLSEIIEALSNSIFTHVSVPVLTKLVEFENKDFVSFVNKIIDKIINNIDMENSDITVADFK